MRCGAVLGLLWAVAWNAIQQSLCEGDFGLGKRWSNHDSNNPHANVCKGRDDGIYLAYDCSERYTVCRQGIAIAMSCTNGLFFNSETFQCDYKHNVLSCNEPISCTGKVNGVYTFGCSPFFWFCTDGIASTSRCPANSFFNRDAVKCDYKENVRECNGEHTSPSHFIPDSSSSAPPKLTSASEEISAEQTSAEQISAEKTSFVQGSPVPSRKTDSVTVAKKTGKGSRGLFAPLSHSMADTNIKPTAISFAETFPTYSVGSVKPPTESPARRMRVSYPYVESSGKRSGKFDRRGDNRQSVSKCADRFLYCVEGKGVAVNCEQGFVYSRRAQSCIAAHPSLGYAEFETVGVKPTASNELPTHEATVVTSPVGSIPDRYRSSCDDLSNGYREMGQCTGKFIICSCGAPTLSSCPSGLIFDPKTLRCDLSRNVVGCAEYGGSIPVCENSAAASEAKVAVPMGQTKTPAAEHCERRQNGLYANGCSEKYTACSDGKSYDFTCPFGLVFNDEVGYCDYVDYVVVCGGKPRGSSKPATNTAAHTSQPLSHTPPHWKAETESALPTWASHEKSACDDSPNGCSPLRTSNRNFFEYSNAKVAVPMGQTKTPAAEHCEHRQNGLYANGCSEKYIACSDGKSHELTCPFGLVFNDEVGYCDYVDYVVVCGGKPRVSTKPVTSTTEHSPRPLSHHWKAETESVVPTWAPLEPAVEHCEHRQNGLYANGCSEKYTACSDGKSHEFTCPFGLVFNEEVGSCDYVDYVVVCGGKPRVSTKPATSTTEHSLRPLSHSSSHWKAETESALPTWAPHEKSFCDDLPNGYYPLRPCNRKFFECSGGATLPSSCPGELVFDSSRQRCDFARNVVGCAEYIAGGSSEHVEQAHASGVERCGSRPNGLYAEGCSEKYFACSKGQFHGFTCRAGLVFNEELGYCDYSDYVVPCGGRPRVFTAPQTTPRPIRYSYPKTNAESAETAESTWLPYTRPSCEGFPNGRFALQPCDRKFFVCANGESSMSSCPGGLVFDSRTSKCEHLQNVPQCDEHFLTSYYSAVGGSLMANFKPKPINKKQPTAASAKWRPTTRRYDCSVSPGGCTSRKPHYVKPFMSQYVKDDFDVVGQKDPLQPSAGVGDSSMVPLRHPPPRHPPPATMRPFPGIRDAFAVPAQLVPGGVPFSPKHAPIPFVKSSFVKAEGPTGDLVDIFLIPGFKMPYRKPKEQGRESGGESDEKKEDTKTEGKKHLKEGASSEEDHEKPIRKHDKSGSEDKHTVGVAKEELLNNTLTGSEDSNGKTEVTTLEGTQDSKDSKGKAEVTTLGGAQDSEGSKGMAEVTTLGGTRDSEDSKGKAEVTTLGGAQDSEGSKGKAEVTNLGGAQDSEGSKGMAEVTSLGGTQDYEDSKGKAEVTTVEGLADEKRGMANSGDVMVNATIESGAKEDDGSNTVTDTEGSAVKPENVIVEGVREEEQGNHTIADIEDSVAKPTGTAVEDSKTEGKKHLKEFASLEESDEKPNQNTSGIVVVTEEEHFNNTLADSEGSQGKTEVTTLEAVANEGHANNTLTVAQSSLKPEDTTIEGSGEDDVVNSNETRIKRYTFPEPSLHFTELSASSSRPKMYCRRKPAGAKMALGFCRQDFILCRDKGRLSVATCVNGELFDGRLLKCLKADECGMARSTSGDPPASVIPQRNGVPSCDVLPDGSYPLSACSPVFVSCESHKYFLRSCAEGLFYNASSKRCDLTEDSPRCAKFLRPSSSDMSMESTL